MRILNKKNKNDKNKNIVKTKLKYAENIKLYLIKETKSVFMEKLSRRKK